MLTDKFDCSSLSEKELVKMFHLVSDSKKLQTAFAWLNLDWSAGVPIVDFTFLQAQQMTEAIQSLNGQIESIMLEYRSRLLYKVPPSDKRWGIYWNMRCFEFMVSHAKMIINNLTLTTKDAPPEDVSLAYRCLVDWKAQFQTMSQLNHNKPFIDNGKETSIFRLAILFTIGIVLSVLLGIAAVVTIIVFSGDNGSFADVLGKIFETYGIE